MSFLEKIRPPQIEPSDYVAISMLADVKMRLNNFVSAEIIAVHVPSLGIDDVIKGLLSLGFTETSERDKFIPYIYKRAKGNSQGSFPRFTGFTNLSPNFSTPNF